jgi:hypothetical protein
MIEHRQFPNLGYIYADIPEDVLTALRNETDMLQADFSTGKKYNKELVGNIEHEYQLSKSRVIVEKFMDTVAKEYFKQNTHLGIFNPRAFHLHSIWANFQKKNEYNPLHNHFGALSFVIWIKVPFDIENEFAQAGQKDAILKTAGCFELAYTDALGQVSLQLFKVDKTFEGKMLVFPSQVKHAVHPFTTSDEYRVSVSGNLIPI